MVTIRIDTNDKIRIIMRSLKSNGWEHHQNGSLEKKGIDKEMCFGQHQD